MTDETEPEGAQQQLERLRVLEAHAWQCFDEAGKTEGAFREKLAALKMIADLVLAQIRYRKETQPQEDIESAEFYMEQYRALKERVDQLAKRRRAL